MSERTGVGPHAAGSPDRGVRIGVDVGTVRVGVAVSDPDGILATPLVTVPREAAARGAASTGLQARETAQETASRAGAAEGLPVPADVAEIARLAREHDAVEVVVGLPINLAGREALAARDVRSYVEILARTVDPIPVKLADERMSTAAASRRLSERGVRGRRHRAVVDQAAAVEILQGWLDARRRRRDA